MSTGLRRPIRSDSVPMKKQPMAEAAEQLLAGTGWLPSVLRTAQPEAEPVEADAGAEVEDEASYAVAAE